MVTIHLSLGPTGYVNKGAKSSFSVFAASREAQVRCSACRRRRRRHRDLPDRKKKQDEQALQVPDGQASGLSAKAPEPFEACPLHH